MAIGLGFEISEMFKGLNTLLDPDYAPFLLVFLIFILVAKRWCEIYKE